MLENIGMPMIYQLVTGAQEWISEKSAQLSTPAVDPEAEQRKAREAEEARIAALRAHGTPVTKESFASWKAKFDAEMELAKGLVLDSGANVGIPAKGRLTGKAWFLQQEASNVEVEEPELGEGEEDGEGSRSTWSGEDTDDYFGKGLLEKNEADEEAFSDLDSDEDDILDSYLAKATND